MGTHCHCKRDSCGGIQSKRREHVETERIRKLWCVSPGDKDDDEIKKTEVT